MRRSLLSLLSICMGIATVLILNSLTNGAKRESLRAMNRMGSVDVVTVSQNAASSLEDEARFARSPGLTYGEMEEWLHVSKYGDALLPEGWSRRSSLKGPKGPKSGHVMGTAYAYFAQNNVQLDKVENESRLSSAWDAGDPICFLGEKLAGELFVSPEQAVGSILEFGELRLRVVGIVRGTSRMDFRRNLCYYPFLLHLRTTQGAEDKIDEIKVRLKNSNVKDAAVDELRAFLLRRHRGIEDFDIQGADEQIAESEKATQALGIVGWVIAGMALAVGGIGILNLMLATVSSRLREIGVRKALGARSASIFGQFLAESVTVSALGTLLGMAIGSAPMILAKDLLPVTPSLGPLDFALALGLGWSVGLLAGLFPAIKAAQLSPVEALRGGS